MNLKIFYKKVPSKLHIKCKKSVIYLSFDGLKHDRLLVLFRSFEYRNTGTRVVLVHDIWRIQGPSIHGCNNIHDHDSPHIIHFKHAYFIEVIHDKNVSA